MKILDWMERRGWIRKREEPIPELVELEKAVEEFRATCRDEAKRRADALIRAFNRWGQE